VPESDPQFHFEHVIEPRPLRLRVLRMVPIVVILGLVVHFVLPRIGQIDESFKTIRTLAPWAIALAVLAEAISYVSNGALLRSVICLAGDHISLRRSIAIEMAAATVALVAAGALGFGAAIYKWTQRRGVSRETAVLASWLPSVFDSMSLIVFALAGAIALIRAHQLSRTSLIALTIVISLLSLCIAALLVLMARNEWMIAIATRTTALLRRVRPKSSNVLVESAERAGSAWTTLRGRGWLRPLFYSLMYLTFDVLALRLVFAAAHQPVKMAVVLAGYGVPMLLGRASFLPGGIAVIEVAMAALYGGMGIPADIAVVVVLTYRLLSFWLPSAIGVPIAIGLQSTKKRKPAASTATARS
jgi:uncharacterized protein (TIRG00374 family)